ncbi:MAG: hypothetical protein LCH87_08635 [Actinobacteria bacterium]|nr:hypothetical protein [Actinomycetota bacterium]
MSRLLAQPFPLPDTPKLKAAYDDLYAAASGVATRIGRDPAVLPRPWDPPSCIDPKLRQELWDWLDKVVDWFNTEYVWDHTGGAIIPACWPLHPHLVHEIASLADQRRRAGIDLTSNSLEEWHRYTVPDFTERLKQRTRTLCDEEHKPWPARSRHSRNTTNAARHDRQLAFAQDVAELDADVAEVNETEAVRPRLHLVDGYGNHIDSVTGEVLPD